MLRQAFTTIALVLCCVASLIGAPAVGKKISDYTETLTLTDSWIYEIAVPGVTNYKVTFGTIATNIIARVPGGIGDVTTAQLNISSNAIVLLTAGSNKVANLIGQATNLTMWSGATNKGNLSLAGSLFRPQPATVRAIGDSITVGSGAAASTNAYVNIIASNTSWTISNLGQSSREMPAFAYSIQPLVVATNDTAFLLTGYNDMRHWGTNASGLRTYEESLRSALVSLSIPDSQKHWISTGAVLNARFTTSGVWEHHQVFYAPNRYTAFSATAGGTISCVMYGSAIYVGFTDRSGLGGLAGNFTITVDGILQTTVYPTNNGLAAEGVTYWPGVARVSDLAEGAHTVLLTISGDVCLDWVAGNDGINGQRTPMVYSAGCLSMRTNGYAIGTPYNNGSDEAARQFRLIHDRVVSELAADGLGVVGVDAYRYFSPHADELTGDFVHPNEAGHVNIARSFLDVISGVPTITERQGSRSGNEFAGLLYRDKQRLGIGTVAPVAVVDINGTPGGTALSVFHAGTNWLTGLTVSSNGNVSIGDPFPDARLDVESLTKQLRLAYDNNTYADITVAIGGLTTFVANDIGTDEGFAFDQTVDVAYAAGTQTSWDLIRAINNSTTSGAAAGIWGVVGGQNVGGIAFVHNGTIADSGSTALLYANGSGMAEGMRVAHTTGNVGIGTPAPSSSLDVTGQVRAASAIFTNSLVVNGVTNTGSGSTQMVTAAIGSLTLTNALSVDVLNVNQINLTNALGSNQVRMGYNDLTNILRRQSVHIGAAAMIPQISEGATFATDQTPSPTNRMVDSFVFSSTITNSVQFNLTMPENWDLSTVKVKLWTSSTNNIATTTNVWAISAAAIKNTSVITNINWGTEVTIKSVVSSTGGQALLTAATPALTVGNAPTAASLVWFRIRRLPGHADDNDGGQQKLLAAWVQYGETMSEVASW